MAYRRWPLRPAMAAGNGTPHVQGDTRNARHTEEQHVSPSAPLPTLMAYASHPPAHSSQTIARPVADAPISEDARRARRERGRFLLATLATILYAILLLAMLFLSTGAVDVGASAQLGGDGKLLIGSVVPSGLSYDSGVRPGDIVVTQDKFSSVELTRLAPRAMDLRGATTLVVQPAQGGNPVTISTKSYGNDESLHLWVQALLGLIFVGVGGPVFVKARQRTAASAFYLLCLLSALALALLPVGVLLVGWALEAVFISVVLWAAMFAYFFFVFPIRVGKTRLHHNIMVVVLLVGAATIVFGYAWSAIGHVEAYSTIRLAALLYVGCCVTSGLGILMRSFMAEKSNEVRQQLVLLLGGTGMAVLPSLLLGFIPFTVPAIGHPLVDVKLTALSLGFMPVAFAYAITQHQLLGVRSFVRRGVIYTVMGSIVLLVISLSAAALAAATPRGWQNNSIGLLAFGFFVFLIAASFSYLQRRIETLVDRYIYHDAYDYKEELLSFSAQLAAEQNLNVLADELVERTCRLMNLSCGVLLLAEHEGTNVFHAETGGLTGVSGQDVMDDIRNHTFDSSILRTSSLAGRGRSENRGRLNIGNPGEGAVVLEPYAKYGIYAEWLLGGLSEELSKLGVLLRQPGTPMQLVYLNEHMGQRLDNSMVGTATIATSPMPAGRGLQNSSASSPNVDGYADVLRWFLGVPLWGRSNFIGVLCLGGKKTGERFTRDDLSLLGTLGSQAALAIYNAQLYEAREQALLDTIAALAHAIEAKDTYTISHCEKITDRAVALAQALALPKQDVENIRLGSILHDVGKIGVPDAVLNKPGKLTDEEYEVIKQHAQIGARIVQSVGALQGVVPIIRHHQERYDGGGYPDGLALDDIPIGARIISVVDAYGAMTEDRVYRKALGHDKAVAELKRFSGTQFDPVVVSTFIRLLHDQPRFAEMELAAIV